jgi:hypothetical protein
VGGVVVLLAAALIVGAYCASIMSSCLRTLRSQPYVRGVGVLLVWCRKRRQQKAATMVVAMTNQTTAQEMPN